MAFWHHADDAHRRAASHPAHAIPEDEQAIHQTPTPYHMAIKTLPLALLAFCIAMGNPTLAQTSDNIPPPTGFIQNKDAKYLLVPTKNIYIFLKLNTSNGEVSLVQYTLSDDKDRFETKTDSYLYPLVSEKEQSNGRFQLYPTYNMYNFLLMDQVDGRVWQLQWGQDAKDRMLKRIQSLQSMKNRIVSLKDTVYVSDLERKDNLFLFNGELYDGTAYSEDLMFRASFRDGRVWFFTAQHFNLKELAFIFDNESDIPDNVKVFYDDFGNIITKEEFVEKYPAVIRQAKEFAKTFK